MDKETLTLIESQLEHTLRDHLVVLNRTPYESRHASYLKVHIEDALEKIRYLLKQDDKNIRGGYKECNHAWIYDTKESYRDMGSGGIKLFYHCSACGAVKEEFFNL